MNDAKNSNPFAGPDWSGLQQQYFDAFTSFVAGPDTMGANQDRLTAWEQAFDYWSDAVETSLPKESHGMFRSMRQQFRSFYSIAGEVAAMVQELTDSGQDAVDWQSVMEARFRKLKAGIDRWITTGQADMLHTLPGFMSPAMMWQHMQSLVPVSPQEIVAKLAAVPGLGAANPVQEKFREGARLWNDYEQNYREYVIVLGELGKLGLDRLAAGIEERTLTGKKISSLGEVYRLWTDANEEVFAEFAFNEDYAKLYANLVNSMLACRQYNNMLLDDILQAAGMPTAEGVNAACKRLQQMRNEFNAMIEIQQQTTRELAKLRLDLAKLNKQPPKRTTSTSTRKPAAKKPAKKQQTGRKKTSS